MQVRLVVLAGLSSGCLGVDADPVPPDPEAPVSDDTVFTETIVTLGPEGPRISEPRPITASEQRAQNETRAAVERGELSPIVDWACSISALWLYERSDWTGNRICFLGNGVVELATYFRDFNGFITNWVLSSGSAWTANQQMLFDGGLTCFPFDDPTCARDVYIPFPPSAAGHYGFIDRYQKKRFSYLHSFNKMRQIEVN